MKTLILSALFINFFSVFCTPKILLTAALVDAYYDFRKNQYIRSLDLFKKFGFENVYIVEALKKSGKTFLDELSKNVFYAQSDNPHLTNKGINEIKTILEALDHFQFSHDDTIIKFTGRYYLLSDYFIKFVEKNENLYDVFIKKNEHDWTLTVAYACKLPILKEILNSIDLGKCEREHISIEKPFGDYINSQAASGRWKVCVMDKLDLQADLFGSSTAPGAPDQIFYF